VGKGPQQQSAETPLLVLGDDETKLDAEEALDEVAILDDDIEAELAAVRPTYTAQARGEAHTNTRALFPSSSQETLKLEGSPSSHQVAAPEAEEDWGTWE
jgi:hypothetical protein